MTRVRAHRRADGAWFSAALEASGPVIHLALVGGERIPRLGRGDLTGVDGEEFQHAGELHGGAVSRIPPTRL